MWYFTIHDPTMHDSYINFESLCMPWIDWRSYPSFQLQSYCVKGAYIRNYSGPHSIRMRQNTDQNNSEYGHFSWSVQCCLIFLLFAKYFVDSYQVLFTFWFFSTFIFDIFWLISGDLKNSGSIYCTSTI